MNLKIMAWSLGCQAYFFIFYLSCSGFFNPTFHAEAIISNHLSLSLVRVTLVHHVPVTVAVLPLQSCSPTFPPWFLPASVSCPRVQFLFPVSSQLMVSGSSCPCWRLVVTFLDLHSWIPDFPLSAASVGTGSYLGNSTLGGSPLLGSWWSPVSWQPNRPSTSGPILEREMSL